MSIKANKPWSSCGQPNIGLSFGFALDTLIKHGSPIRRHAWPKDQFVYQMRASAFDIPGAVHALWIKSKNKRVGAYTPSGCCLFAQDWEVLDPILPAVIDRVQHPKVIIDHNLRIHGNDNEIAIIDYIFNGNAYDYRHRVLFDALVANPALIDQIQPLSKVFIHYNLFYYHAIPLKVYLDIFNIIQGDDIAENTMTVLNIDELRKFYQEVSSTMSSAEREPFIKLFDFTGDTEC